MNSDGLTTTEFHPPPAPYAKLCGLDPSVAGFDRWPCRTGMTRAGEKDDQASIGGARGLPC